MTRKTGDFYSYFIDLEKSASEFSLNIFERFTKLSRDMSCTFDDFRIDKVLDGSAPVDFDAVFSIDSEGIFKVKRFDLNLKLLRVYISAFNGAVWTEGLGSFLTISTEGSANIPNMAPKFLS